MKEEEMKEQVKFISECGMYMDLEYWVVEKMAELYERGRY